MILHGKFGRQITDLRISITDRGNFRCVYCRSADPENYRDHNEILSWPELPRLAGVFLSLGIRKIRTTGGERPARGRLEESTARLHPRGDRETSLPPHRPLAPERCHRALPVGPHRTHRPRG